jgi:hypothetical protein
MKLQRHGHHLVERCIQEHGELHVDSVSERIKWILFRQSIVFGMAIVVSSAINARAQTELFSISSAPGPHSWGPGETEVYIDVFNNSSSDMISSFVVSNIYSSTSPSQLLHAGPWGLAFNQNPTNSCLWDVQASAPTIGYHGIAYIAPNEDILMSFISTCPTNAQLLFGALANSVVFLNAGFVLGNPSTMIGPVGWQSGPLLAAIAPGQTNGSFQLSWTGADGNVYVDFKKCLTETNWQTLAGPLSGGACTITVSTNSPGGFFRLKLGP